MVEVMRKAGVLGAAAVREADEGWPPGPNDDMDGFAAPAGCVTEYQFLRPGMSSPADRRNDGTWWIRLHNGTVIRLQSMCGR
ncbi:hypothetical protein ILP97_40115 [Amycolatopsis sp. H6(2020)]|nr:hypothetical protein [Amycolatopsis sp. H6(2020)]